MFDWQAISVRDLVAQDTLGRLLDKSHQDDIAQDVCLALWNGLRGGKLDTSLPIGPWLREVVRTTVLDFLKKAGRQRDRPAAGDLSPRADRETAWQSSDTQEDPESQMSRMEREAGLLRAIHLLPEGDRRIVLLVLADQSVPAIAAALETRPANINYRLKRIFEKLRKLLEAMGITLTPLVLDALLDPRAAHAASPPPPAPSPLLDLATRLSSLLKGTFGPMVFCVGLGAFLGAGDSRPALAVEGKPPRASVPLRDEDPGETAQKAPERGDGPSPDAPDAGSLALGPFIPGPGETAPRANGSPPVPTPLPPWRGDDALEGRETELDRAGRNPPAATPRDVVPEQIPAALVAPILFPPVAAETLPQSSVTGGSPLPRPGTNVDLAPAEPFPESEEVPSFNGELFVPGCEVAWTSPPTAAQNVAITERIEVSWSVPVDPASLFGQIRITRDDQESVDFSMIIVDEQAVRLVPESSLNLWGSYRVAIGAGVQTKTGWLCAAAATVFSTVAPSLDPRPLLPMPADGLALAGGQIFVASIHGGGVQKYAFSASGVPALSAEGLTPLSLKGTLEARAGLMLAAAGTGGVVRVSPDGAPAVTIATGGDARDVAMFQRGNKVYALVANGAGGIRLLSTTAEDAASPVIDLGALDTGVPTVNVTTVAANDDGSRVAFVDNGQIKVATCPDPSAGACSSTAMTAPGATVSDLVVDAAFLFVATTSKGVLAYDLEDPDVLPVSACGPEAACAMSDLWAQGGEVVAAAGLGGALRFAFEGGQLVHKGTYPVADTALSVQCDGGRVIVGTYSGPCVFEKAGGALLSGDAAGFGIATDVVFAGDYAYVASGLRGLLTYAIGPDGVPVWKDQDLSPGALPYGITINGSEAAVRLGLVNGRLVLGDGKAGLSLYDISNPANPKPLGSVDTADGAGAVAAAGDFAYVCDANNGVLRVDVSGSAPVVKESLLLDGKGGCEALAVDGDQLYVAGSAIELDGSFKAFLGIVDLAAPAPLYWMARAKMSEHHTFRSIAVSRGYVFLTARTLVNGPTQRHLVVMAPDGMADPKLVWRSENIGAYSVAVTGTQAFVAALQNGVHVYDVVDPAEPRLLGVVATPGLALAARPRASDVFIVEGATTGRGGRGLRRIWTDELPP